MAWVNVNGHRYCRRSRRVVGRVVTEHVGGGRLGRLSAEWDAAQRELRRWDGCHFSANSPDDGWGPLESGTGGTCTTLGRARRTPGAAYHTPQGVTAKRMTGGDIWRLMKWKLLAPGLHTHFSPHSFRATVATNLLEQDVKLEDVQHLLGHCDPRTTRMDDRRQPQVTRNIVERIGV